MKTILLLLILLPGISLAQHQFRLKGSILPIPVPAKAFLYYNVDGKSKVDSAVINGGKFTFSGTVPEPLQAHIKIKRNPVANGIRTPSDIFSFLLEPGHLVITSQNDSVSRAVITGSELNEGLARFNAMANDLREKAEAVTALWKAGTREQQKDSAYTSGFNVKLKALQEEGNNIGSNFIDANRDATYSLLLFRSLIKQESSTAADEFAKFSPRLKASPLGRRIQATIEGAKMLAIGKMAMDFTQNDVNGKPVKLSDFKGKYVLIDFWASWCGPCRIENPNVVKAYKKFKDKNFTVLGISLDNPGKKAEWLKAIQKDGLEWTQLSDLKGFNNEVARMYQVKAIPTNFLIGPDGKILAKNLRASGLEVALTELLSGEKNSSKQ